MVNNNVGRSDFRVDIAITDATDPDSYCIGIIIDGLNYRALPTIRDREITIPAVLENLGWRIHRIWALDWLDNPDAVIRHISEMAKPQHLATPPLLKADATRSDRIPDGSQQDEAHCFRM